MNVNVKIVPEAVGIISADSKEAILTALAQQFAEVYGVNSDSVLESLEEREALGSTGFGRGVAIPHARVDTISMPVAVLFRLDAPVDFGAADGMPVDLVFGMLSPTNAGVGHLHALAAISRTVRDDAIRQAMSEAQTPEALYSMLTNVSDRDVA
ncbi:PTS sugar transporter subunit IIA [Pontixanthobacter aestiaquae]|uniref:PTS transporter subunit EIIA n=1 Tax=Pontixanthobacter aestiaquae TaxID=1509367 RepID=A0A844Z4D2_9SPHN|nr:PTS sugar transporter subunit IIA [Pontixanthobacter aestiaquae]MDN3646882.1 PTS sugar transporter subunit IIA [Pontixanthobacter aestiaquae]MXO82136.1 PTS transporter subunit EIIA [Pontixanthobacter aestiaquae]